VGKQSGANSLTLEHSQEGSRAFYSSFTMSGIQAGRLIATLVFIPVAALPEDMLIANIMQLCAIPLWAMLDDTIGRRPCISIGRRPCISIGRRPCISPESSAPLPRSFSTSGAWGVVPRANELANQLCEELAELLAPE
jgi:hypothetical protein